MTTKIPALGHKVFFGDKITEKLAYFLESAEICASIQPVP